MARLHSRRALDPRWAWHQRSVPIGHMSSVCEVFRRTGDANDYGWDPSTGGIAVNRDVSEPYFPPVALIYRGRARAATNKDWRARTRTARSDSGIIHAVRFQIPERLSPPVHSHDILRVVDSPPDQELQHYIFHVRNVMMSSNAWVRNLLCDVDVGHPQLLPPPYEGEPLSADSIPEPFRTGCSCGE